jgi:hypothetical protein
MSILAVVTIIDALIWLRYHCACLGRLARPPALLKKEKHMHYPYRASIAAAIVATSAVLATYAAFAGDTDDIFLAANQAVMGRAEQISPRSAALSPDTASTQSQETSPAVYGADPDPSKFDRVGLETWWAKYRKEHLGH